MSSGDGNVDDPVSDDPPDVPTAPDSEADRSGSTQVEPILLPPSKLKRTRSRGGLRAVVEWVVVIGGAFLLAWTIQTFLFQPFRIPSGSMIPTLDVGDRIVVNKLSYRFGDPDRGDLVVFTTPDCEDSTSPDWANCTIVGEYDDLVKRIVGLPGDRLAIADDGVYIDGERLEEPYVEPGAMTVAQPPYGCTFPGTPEEPYVVPEGMVFVMGDNRGNSLDSRCFGPVSESSLVGRAFVVIWPFGHLKWL